MNWDVGHKYAVHYTTIYHKTIHYKASVPFINSWFLKIYEFTDFIRTHYVFGIQPGGSCFWTGSLGAARWPMSLSSSGLAWPRAQGGGRGRRERSLFHHLVESHLLPSIGQSPFPSLSHRSLEHTIKLHPQWGGQGGLLGPLFNSHHHSTAAQISYLSADIPLSSPEGHQKGYVRPFPALWFCDNCLNVTFHV